MKREKRETIKAGIGFKVYRLAGRYFVDLHKIDSPAHSYESMQGVVEALYYGGYIAEKSVDSLMAA